MSPPLPLSPVPPPQGLGQCVGYLARHYPSAEIVPVSSTARAAQRAQLDPHSLAICSPKCADVYKLDVIDTDIQDGGAGQLLSLGARARGTPDCLEGGLGGRSADVFLSGGVVRRALVATLFRHQPIRRGLSYWRKRTIRCLINTLSLAQCLDLGEPTSEERLSHSLIRVPLQHRIEGWPQKSVVTFISEAAAAVPPSPGH